jgi:hypothetical protein
MTTILLSVGLVGAAMVAMAIGVILSAAAAVRTAFAPSRSAERAASCVVGVSSPPTVAMSPRSPRTSGA